MIYETLLITVANKMTQFDVTQSASWSDLVVLCCAALCWASIFGAVGHVRNRKKTKRNEMKQKINLDGKILSIAHTTH